MARKTRRQAENFGGKRTTRAKARRYKSKTTTRSKIRETWNEMNQGWKGTVLYVLLGVGLALLTKQALAVGLSTEMPVVAVVSPSMQHDNADVTHYSWLVENLDYERSYINSWSVPTGFMIGDMPIVKGEKTNGYEVGDVVVYSVPAQKYPIIHRIIKINDDGTYQTKGDNNMDQLPYEFSIRDEQIFGKVVLVIPKLGYFKVMLTKLFAAG
jgi:signal peptidase I